MNLYLPRYRESKPIDLVLRSTVSGKYKVEVCRNGHVVRRPFGDRWIPNLITNAGLDQLMANASPVYFYQMLSVCCRAGSGTTAPANTDTQLTTPLKFCNTPNTGGGISTSYDTVNGYATHTYVYEFSTEAGAVTYNEIGTATTGALSGGSLFTHSLFPSGVALATGDNLRLTYSITFSIPAIITPITISQSAINGFNISGQLKVIGTFVNIFGQFASNGGVAGGQDAGIRGVGNAPRAGLYTAPTVFPAVNATPSFTLAGTLANGALGSYTNGSFTRTTQYVFATNNPASSTSVAGILFQDSNTQNAGAYLLFTTPQTKANTNTLTLNYTSTLARV